MKPADHGETSETVHQNKASFFYVIFLQYLALVTESQAGIVLFPQSSDQRNTILKAYRVHGIIFNM